MFTKSLSQTVFLVVLATFLGSFRGGKSFASLNLIPTKSESAERNLGSGIGRSWIESRRGQNNCFSSQWSLKFQGLIDKRTTWNPPGLRELLLTLVLKCYWGSLVKSLYTSAEIRWKFKSKQIIRLNRAGMDLWKLSWPLVNCHLPNPLGTQNTLLSYSLIGTYSLFVSCLYDALKVAGL